MPANVDALHPRSIRYLYDSLHRLITGRLWLQVLIGMVLGLAVGTSLGPELGLVSDHTARVLGAWLALPGWIFLALIQMVVIALVVASIIRGIAASENVEQLRRLGSRVAVYFVATTLIAVTVGVTVGELLQPGARLSGTFSAQALASPPSAAVNEVAPPTFETLPGRIVGLLPANPLHSMAEGQMLHSVVLALVFGIALIMLPPKQAKPLLDLLGSLQAVSMLVVRWAMHLAPIAVFGLLAQMAMTVGWGVMLGMLFYVAAVLLGLAVLAGFYFAMLFFVGKLGPRRFLRAAREALLLAFSTSSSAAVMPVTVRCSESLGVRPSISQFVIPIGTTINMDGTALYQVVAVFFLAQVFGIDLTWPQVLVVVFMTVGASIGSPGTPGVGIAILAATLQTVGIPAAGIGLVLGVDRILDMSRTTVNVAGDLTASVVMDRWVGGTRTHVDEAIEQADFEERRSVTGEDVIIGS